MLKIIQRLNTEKISFLIIFFLLLFQIHTLAQTETPEKKWHFLTDVYLMFPNINGETGIGELLVPIDASAGDVFSNLKIGGMFYFEAQTSKWALTSDIVFMNLNEDITPGKIIESGEVTGKQFIWEAAALYRIAPFWEVGVGGRLNNLDVGIDVNRRVLPSGTEAVSGSKTATWYDPVLITRLATDINNKWLFQFRGDVGGFGIGSDFTWQLGGYVGYRFTKVFQLTGGYRILSMDYNKDVKNTQFVFDVDEFGPVIRLGFNF
jgi:hypothetical protein